MNDALQTEIANELGKEEILLWSGKPRQGIIFRAYDIFLIPISLLWGGFVIPISIFIAFSVIINRNISFVGTIGILLIIFPFFLLGVYIIFGRFIHDIQIRARTYYGLTNKRVIIISGIFRRKINSINLWTITAVSFHENRNEKGTIVFGSSSSRAALPSFFSLPGLLKPAPSFDMIENAFQVYEKVRDIQLESG